MVRQYHVFVQPDPLVTLSFSSCITERIVGVGRRNEGMKEWMDDGVERWQGTENSQAIPTGIQIPESPASQH
jgi:hypothetical protein